MIKSFPLRLILKLLFWLSILMTAASPHEALSAVKPNSCSIIFANEHFKAIDPVVWSQWSSKERARNLTNTFAPLLDNIYDLRSTDHQSSSILNPAQFTFMADSMLRVLAEAENRLSKVRKNSFNNESISTHLRLLRLIRDLLKDAKKISSVSITLAQMNSLNYNAINIIDTASVIYQSQGQKLPGSLSEKSISSIPKTVDEWVHQEVSPGNGVMVVGPSTNHPSIGISVGTDLPATIEDFNYLFGTGINIIGMTPVDLDVDGRTYGPREFRVHDVLHAATNVGRLSTEKMRIWQQLLHWADSAPEPTRSLRHIVLFMVHHERPMMYSALLLGSDRLAYSKDGEALNSAVAGLLRDQAPQTLTRLLRENYWDKPQINSPHLSEQIAENFKEMKLYLNSIMAP